MKVHYCFVAVILCLLSEAKGKPNTDDISRSDEFVQLINRVGPSRRVHLISEVVQDGQRVELEEFLDLNSYNQLIQFKWHSINERNDLNLDSDESYKQRLTTTKVNLLILNENGDQRKFMYQYEEDPFRCQCSELSSDESQAKQDWRKYSHSRAEANESAKELQIIDEIIQSIKSTANNSPYLTRLDTENNGRVWLFGVSGLWLKATDNLHSIKHVNDLWRLELQETNLIIDYYQESSLLDGSRTSMKQVEKALLSNTQYDLVSFIDIKRTLSGGAEETFHLINIVDVSFHFSDKLARNLFTLPIGYGCAQNALINQNGLYFRETVSQSMEFEVIATKYNPTSASVFVENEMKTIEINQVKHPMDSSKNLFSLHIREDQTKQMRDFHLKLGYFIRLNGTSQSKCSISHLTNDEPVRLMFKNSGLTILINGQSLDYLLAFNELEQRQMRLLNLLESSESHYEYVFESQLEQENKKLFINMVDLTGKIIKNKITIVRVFKQKAVGGGRGLNLPKRVMRRGLLDLSRVIVMIFNEARTRKLAEIRFNLIGEIHTMSFTRRANKFDLSKCYDLSKESMQLVASYPVDAPLIDYLRETNGHQELVERFYASNLNNNNPLHGHSEHHTRQLAIGSLNFLRAPKVSLSLSQADQLELHLTLLDAIKPLIRFHSIDQSSLEVDQLDGPNEETLLVGSLEQCSQFCQQLSCKTFSYDARHECKLSHFQINQTDSIKVVPKRYSKLYYSPIEQSEETTLGELASYLEHFASELANYDEKIDTQDGENINNRLKRSSPVNQLPLMSFDFTDRSGLLNEYSPPKTRVLVPSRVNLIRFPTSMDVSMDSIKSLQLAESFQAQEFGRCFKLDSKEEGPVSSKTFVDKLNQVYYTLKRLESIEQQNCALICLNIDEWNRKTSSEQVCISFSYSRFRLECIMLIKTDFAYVNSLQDLLTEPNATEIVHEVSSIDELLVEDAGGLLAKRDYLYEFDGPIRLSHDFYGYKTTDSMLEELEQKRQIQFNWLQVFQNEAADFSQLAVSKQECPIKCLQRNKNRNEICLSFDYCSRLYLGLGGEKRYQVSCNLLLLKENNQTNKRQFANNVNWLRSRLAQVTHENKNESLTEATKQSKSVCQRYLLSHLRDFNNLKQRAISPDLTKSIVYGRTSNEFNLDSCALECHLQGSNKCLGFQYCLSLDNNDSSNVERDCGFIGPLVSMELGEIPTHNEKMPTTNHNKNCHIYLLNQFNSLEEALQYKPGEEDQLSKQPFRHWGLVICFIVVYVGLTVAFIVWYLRRRDSAIRERISTMLTQINTGL